MTPALYPGAARDIIAIGASAGGVPALRKLFASISPGFPASIFVVLHRSPFHDDHLTDVLRGNTGHKVVEPRDGDAFERGCIYVAPRDLHLVLERLQMRVLRDPKEHYTRPAIDPLFRSAASTFGSRVIGVLLSGFGQDGLIGLIAIKGAGGLTLVQDPAEAQNATMPRNAIEKDSPDEVLGLTQIAGRIRDSIERRR